MDFASAARQRLVEDHGARTEQEQLSVLTELNVLAQIDNLHTHPSVRQALADDCLDIHAWVCHIQTGEVLAHDVGRGRFERWPPPKTERSGSDG